MTAVGTLSLTRPVRASLEFRDVGGQTHLMGQHTPHPFHITRPFRHVTDPQGMATLYLQSSSGGLYGDDDLGLTVRLGEGAAAHVTTQASTIVHDARDRAGAQQDVLLEVGPGGWLEYLPDPAILMTGARLNNRVSARLGEGARLIMADAQLSHDPGGDGRPFGRLDNVVAVTGPQGPLMLDRFGLEGADWLARTGGARCSGMVVAAGADEAGPAMLAAVDALPGLYAGLSVFPDRGLGLLRFLARDGVALSRALSAAWTAARVALTGASPHARRK
ncbi:urease accessory protein UreD [Pseudooceanicola batsensis HTCC2597]|uniref:Urease accessory protein UreD n=1 Tax=Pseudooceanicola batsensis (strain ATCC BAA-863 / DSM 15984 / KCTC 12145 / HTCC2597) TaxID=252305 RepID=A3U2Z3_PSEBH|nr:urease accessory protein UreD [Pseudooceanicola batsensis]EAQ01523.1 urease accessory protein UreD [Pseudooceanicola batsensis HTCC2597]